MENLKKAIEKDLQHQGIEYEIVETNIAFKSWPFAKWSLSRYAVAVDALSSEYVEWLRKGDGPVSFGLYRPGSQASPLPGVFFDKRQHSPTDRPEHFAHANGATTFSAVWLAGSPAERQILDLPAGVFVAEKDCAPFGSSEGVLALKDGEIGPLPAGAQILPGRPIVAATVTVENLAATRQVLTSNHIGVREVDGCARKSLWVQTHALWLEFRQR